MSHAHKCGLSFRRFRQGFNKTAKVLAVISNKVFSIEQWRGQKFQKQIRDR